MPNTCTVTGQLSDIFAKPIGEVTVEFRTTKQNLWRSGEDVISVKRQRVKSDDLNYSTFSVSHNSKDWRPTLVTV